MNAASRPTTSATITVLFTGVWVRGLTFANVLGSSPSRPIANRMRVWPYIVTSVTEKIEITAPADRIVPGQDAPTTSCRILASPASPCSGSAKSCHGCVPRADTATRT